jgi:hypothetical protein
MLMRVLAEIAAGKSHEPISIPPLAPAASA